MTNQEIVRVNDTSLATTTSQRAIERIEATEAEYRREQFVLECMKLRQILASEVEEEVAKHIGDTMIRIAEHMHNLGPRIRKLSPEYRDFMLRFCEEQLSNSSEHLWKLKDATLKGVAKVVCLSLMVEPPPPPPTKVEKQIIYYQPQEYRRGWLARLIGL